MKTVNKSSLILFALLATFALQNCEWDAKTPLYYDDHVDPSSPTITGMNPADAALGGVNKITVLGENFSTIPENNAVYFDDVKAEIISSSATAISVFRPAVVSDTATVKVVSTEALIVAKYSPYKLSAVVETAHAFLENNPQVAITFDAEGNLYTSLRTKELYKISTNGQETLLGSTDFVVSDLKVGPNGKLIAIQSNKVIQQIDRSTGEVSEFINCSIRVTKGDFDANGNLFVSGRRTGIVVIHPDLTETAIAQYVSDTILSMRVYNGYLYVYNEARSTTPKYAIWRHQILDANGSLGAAELFLDWTQVPEYGELDLIDFTFDTDGTVYLATEHENPILMIHPDQTQEILFRGQITSPAVALSWDNANHLLMLQGGDTWQIVKIDVGIMGAPYYGR